MKLDLPSIEKMRAGDMINVDQIIVRCHAKRLDRDDFWYTVYSRGTKYCASTPKRVLVYVNKFIRQAGKKP